MKPMKFNFKVQQYQTDAVESIVKVFNGQGRHEGISYVRDLGKRDKAINYQIPLENDLLDLQGHDPEDDTGFKNEGIALTDKQLLNNIHQQQTHNNIKLSPLLINDLGKCSLDIEMETGERVIIVTGCINVLVSRVSGTFIQKNRALLRAIRYNCCKQCMRSKDFGILIIYNYLV